MENVAQPKGIKYWIREKLYLVILIPFLLWGQPFGVEYLSSYLDNRIKILAYMLPLLIFLNFYFFLKMVDFPFFKEIKILTIKEFALLNLSLSIFLTVCCLLVYLIGYIPQAVEKVVSTIFFVILILVGIVFCFHLVQKAIEKDNT
jgi:hypothetical protein